MRRAAALLALTALAACSLEPKDLRPDLPVPPSWPVGDAYLRQTEAALPSVPYTQVFTDRRLQAIISEALANNRDLRVSLANIDAAREQYRIQRADLFPEVDASSRVTRSGGGSGTSGSTTASGSTTTTGATSSGSGSGRTTFSLSGGVSAYELDLFGRVRSLTRAAQDRYFAQEAGARATRLTLVGEVATAWLTYASDQSLLQIAQQTAATARESVRLTNARLQGGIAPRTDLAQAQTVLATAEADVADQRTAVAQDVNALTLLVGAPVDPSLLPRSIDEAAPTVAPIPAGLDSRVLLRRPDVVQAEYTLRAYNAEIGAARAQLFPSISLTSIVGLASTALTSLFTGGAFTYSVGPAASYPIFRAGAGRAEVRYSQAQREAALATYEKTIQTAFRDVADALARRGTIADLLSARQRNVAAAADTLRLTTARYQGGIDTFLATLDAQRTLYTAQRSASAARLTEATNLVTLYQALGGDSTLDATAAGPQLTGQAAPAHP